MGNKVPKQSRKSFLYRLIKSRKSQKMFKRTTVGYGRNLCNYLACLYSAPLDILKVYKKLTKHFSPLRRFIAIIFTVVFACILIVCYTVIGFPIAILGFEPTD